MRRKLILIFLSLAIFSSVFAVLAMALDGELTDADEVVEVEKKKLSEFTDEEFEEFFKGRELTAMSVDLYKDDPEQFWQGIRGGIVDFENKIDQMFFFGYWDNYIYAEELRAVVATYYGLECEHAYPLMYESYFNTIQEKFGDEVEKKKLSEFTDAELLEYLEEKDVVMIYDDKTFSDKLDYIDFARSVIVCLEDDINYDIGLGWVQYLTATDELRLIVAEYYGVEITYMNPCHADEIEQRKAEYGLK